jgi:hypothetical protein
MPGNAPSYLRPGAVDRIFGHTLGFLVRIGVIRGHFYVLGVPLVHAMKVPPGLGLKPLATTDLCQDTKSGRPNSVFIKAG